MAEAAARGGARAAAGDPGVSAPRERSVKLLGDDVRILEKGEGAPLGFLPTFGGVPGWTPFLDRLAEHRRVVVPSLPGFPGAGGGFRRLDDLADWVSATLDLLEHVDELGEVRDQLRLLGGHRARVIDDEDDVEVAVDVDRDALVEHRVLDRVDARYLAIRAARQGRETRDTKRRK